MEAVMILKKQQKTPNSIINPQLTSEGNSAFGQDK